MDSLSPPGTDISMRLIDSSYRGDDVTCPFTINMYLGDNGGQHGLFACAERSGTVPPLDMELFEDNFITIHYNNLRDQQDTRFWIMIQGIVDLME